MCVVVHPVQHWLGYRRPRPPVAERREVLCILLDALEHGGRGAEHHFAASTSQLSTVLHMAAGKWVPCADPELQQLGRRLVASAVAAGVSIDARNADGLTPLHMAAASRSEFALCLLEAGADPT